jgi:hypothetical protein
MAEETRTHKGNTDGLIITSADRALDLLADTVAIGIAADVRRVLVARRSTTDTTPTELAAIAASVEHTANDAAARAARALVTEMRALAVAALINTAAIPRATAYRIIDRAARGITTSPAYALWAELARLRGSTQWAATAYEVARREIAESERARQHCASEQQAKRAIANRRHFETKLGLGPDVSGWREQRIADMIGDLLNGHVDVSAAWIARRIDADTADAMAETAKLYRRRYHTADGINGFWPAVAAHLARAAYSAIMAEWTPSDGPEDETDDDRAKRERADRDAHEEASALIATRVADSAILAVTMVPGTEHDARDLSARLYSRRPRTAPAEPVTVTE